MCEVDLAILDELGNATGRQRVVIAAEDDRNIGRLSSHLTNNPVELRGQQKRLDHFDIREFGIPVHVSVADNDFLRFLFWIIR